MANHSATHPKHVHHHFVDSNQQFESAKLGMWVFLVNEILFFGGLFCAYIVFRAWYPELFTQAALELNTFWGAVNTVVLIGSSLTVAMAIRSAQNNQKRGLEINLLITILLACVFLVIKYFEYEHKLHLGIAPGSFWNPTPEIAAVLDHPKANIFFGHLLHDDRRAWTTRYYWDCPYGLAIHARSQRAFQLRVLYPGRNNRIVLALSGFDLDFPFPTLILNRMTRIHTPLNLI